MHFQYSDGRNQILNTTSGKSLMVRPHPYQAKKWIVEITGPHGGVHGQMEIDQVDMEDLIKGLGSK